MTRILRACSALLLACLAWGGLQRDVNAAVPNILVIYADDLGYGDVSCYNPDRGRIPTPHIDRLAAEGMRFTDAHSSSGVCSPSRYTLLTGRYHWRTRLQSGIVGLWEEPLIAAERLTVGELLRQQGYRTACIGKWHLGWQWPIEEGKESLFRGSNKEDVPATPEHRAAWQNTFSAPIPGGPISRGFDEYFGTDVPNWPPFCFIDQDRTVGIPTEYLPARLFQNNQASLQGPALKDWTLEPILPALGDRACEFIARVSQEDRPFFLYMPLTSPHTPLSVNRQWLGKSGLNLYADFVMETDAVVGQVLRALKTHGLADSTLVLLTSDNGCAPYIGAAELEQQGHYPSGPLRGYKSDVWEGGHRVAFIVRWPGNVGPGTVCDQLVHQADLIATCAEAVGARLPADAGEDSFSLLPLLRGGSAPVRQSAVSQSSRGLTSIRRGPWKLIFGPGSGGWSKGQDAYPAQLYHLGTDLAESENLYARHPEIVAELTELMERYVRNGRSTPGPNRTNDVPVQWKRFLKAEDPAAAPRERQADQAAGRSTIADTDQAAQVILEQSGVQGGLIVHLGCGDGRLTAALGAGKGYLVHGLERDAARREQAREHIHSLGLYGAVSIDTWDGERLPYAENLVNLIVAEQPDAVIPAEMLRVLTPRGVALVRQGAGWKKMVKPWPAEMDEWTHYLHGPSNNAVAADTVVGPPRHLQWVGPPRWSRSHEHLGNLSAAVSSGGRLFAILDKGPTADVTLAPNWTLVARDAFNGVLLWERPLGPWEWRLRGFRSGPPDLARRLVAVDDRVYVTLGYGLPVTALDAATGETVRVYDQTERTQEVVLSGGVLYLVVGDEPQEAAAQARRAAATDRIWHWWPIYAEPRPRTELLAVEAESGRLLWRKTGLDVEHLMPTTLAVAGDRVFFQNSREVVCLDARAGRPIWRAERPISRQRMAWTAPTLVVYDAVVLSADRQAPADAGEEGERGVEWTVTSQGGIAPPGELIAFSADTGERLWSAPCREGYNAPVDVLVAGGLVWTGNLVGAGDPGILEGRDPHTGEVQRTRPRDQEFYQPIMSHARCYRHKATERYLLTGRSGVEFVDVVSGEAIAHHWVRGECQYGILPCNGLLYAPPHPCACFILAKLNSFLALAPGAEESASPVAAGGRLEKGPAYVAVEPDACRGGDWPTFRHDPARRGSTEATVAPNLEAAWAVPLPAPLTAPVAAEGRVYVASIDTHTVHALEAETGRQLWHFTAGGRVDSPPTICSGRVLFGSADGWVYCLRARDGTLAWRHRAAPTDRLVAAYGQLESAWPVHGSVLVLAEPDRAHAVVYATAGRSGYLDGGIVLVRLDAESGQELSRTPVDSRDPETGRQPHPLPRPAPGFSMPGALNDVLSSQEGSVFMRHLRFSHDGSPQEQTVPHLHSPAGFLDDSWWHRTYWIVGTEMHGGWGSWPTMGTLVPSGRLLVLDDRTIYGFGRDRYDRDGSHVGLGGAKYRLFARSRSTDPRREAGEDVFFWEQQVDMLVRAMVLAGETLFVAGPDGALAAEDPVAVWEGHADGLLWAVSAETGKKQAAYRLDAPPVFDGLIATPGRLLFSTTDGRVVCFAARGEGAATQ